MIFSCANNILHRLGDYESDGARVRGCFERLPFKYHNKDETLYIIYIW